MKDLDIRKSICNKIILGKNNLYVTRYSVIMTNIVNLCNATIF